MKNSKWALWIGVILGVIFLLNIFSGNDSFDYFPLLFFVAGGFLIYYGFKGKSKYSKKVNYLHYQKKESKIISMLGCLTVNRYVPSNDESNEKTN